MQFVETQESDTWSRNEIENQIRHHPKGKKEKEKEKKSLGLVKQAFKLNLLLSSRAVAMGCQRQIRQQVFGYIYSVVFGVRFLVR